MSQPVENTDPVAGGNTDQTPTEPVQEPRLSHEDALRELSKVRAEAASRRVANKELEDQAKRWREYEESQKTELQKLQDAVAERDKRLAQKELEVTRAKIAKEFNVDDSDLDLLTGDEDSMKRLAAKLGKQDSRDEPKRPVDLLAGTRGVPVTKNSQFDMDAFIRGSAR